MTISPPAPAAPARRRIVPPGRLLEVAAADLGEHADLLGPIPWAHSRSAFVDLVAASGLRGRGGAAFPTATKLAALGAGPVVVANGAEGEPGSRKDLHLLRTSPHLVLDGLQLVAHAVGAREAWVYVTPAALDVVRAAVAERQVVRLDRVPVQVLAASGGFVAGQETAVVSAVEGGAPVPRYGVRRITEKGVRGRPTLVQNVETLAHLAMIARFGPAWFRSAGVEESPGTWLATVHGPGGQMHVRELPHGTSLDGVLRSALSDVAVDHVRAVLVGGYHGTWHSWPETSGDRLSARAVGAGVVVPLPVDECGLAATARITRYLAGGSARQCGPCRFGLPSLADAMDALVRGRTGPGGLAAVEQAAGLVVGRGACHHPDGTVRLVRSALDVFSRDVDAHLHGSCLTSPAVTA